MTNSTPKKLLAACILPLLATGAHAEQNTVSGENLRAIEPNVDRRELHDARMDTEAFELGTFVGTLSVDGFTTNAYYGVSGTVHFTNRMVMQANTSRSEVDKANVESLDSGSMDIGEDREFSHFDLQFGYNLFPGRSFFASGAKFNSGVFLMGGIGKSTFAQSSSTTLVLGSSYRVVLTDWLSFNVDFRDYIFRSDLLEDDKSTHNLSFFTGINVLF